MDNNGLLIILFKYNLGINIIPVCFYMGITQLNGRVEIDKMYGNILKNHIEIHPLRTLFSIIPLKVASFIIQVFQLATPAYSSIYRHSNFASFYNENIGCNFLRSTVLSFPSYCRALHWSS